MTEPATPGTLVTPSIELQRRIGAGGMGTVWVAHHRGLRKDVVVKLMAESILSSAELRSRFAQEAIAGANVRSPHVVQVFDTGIHEALGPYIVMELLEGEDLGARLAREETLPPALVARIVSQAAHALDRAHANGIVHRDIKPANLFLCADEGGAFTTKVLDFGVATLRLESVPRTAIGVSVGTPTYMSPEQAAARQDLDGKSDLYALGLVAFRALTGAVAFPRESVEALGLGVYNLPVPKPSERRSSLPRAVDSWFERACARDRDARFADGATMAAELSRALGIEVPEVTPLAAEHAVPRSEGPTQAHSPAAKPLPLPPPPALPSEAVATTETGLAQRTRPGGAELPSSPPKRRGMTLAAVLATLAIAGGGYLATRTDPPLAPVVAAPPSAKPEPTATPIPIGVLLDLSGERRENGNKLLAATVAAEEHINRAGGIRGRPVRLVVRDDQGDTGAFLADAARALLNVDGLKVIVGPITSPQVSIVAPIAQAGGVLEITATATSPELTTMQRPEERLLFRTIPSQTVQAKALARVMRGAGVSPLDKTTAAADPKPVHCATAALVATDDVTGKPFVDVFTRSFVASGGRVVATRFVAAEDQASYEAEIDAVVQSRAECQVLVLGPKAAARYLRQSLAEPLEHPGAVLLRTFGVNNLATSDFIAYARAHRDDPTSPSVADGVRGVRPATTQRWRPEYLELAHLLTVNDAGTGVSTAPFVANQFDAVLLGALTLESAGTDANAEELRKGIRRISRRGRVYGPHELPQLLAAIRRGEEVDFVGTSGDLDLDENGDVESDLVTWIAKSGVVIETGRVPAAVRRPR